VKIDGSFVRGITSDPVDRAIVESVNRISQEMGLRTVAEFVETDAIMDALRGMGVDYGQGWALGAPRPFDGWLAANPVVAPPPRGLDSLVAPGQRHR
jgi:EAL domain-containing protein (putative c-di-GMP-specific phosphodiesterase class I)